jgi:predicted site-specific integrase-resolvase
MKRYTTQEVAKTIGVGYQTLLRWLYAGKLAEPERMIYGGQNLRLWTKDDIQRARKYKVEGLPSRRNRKPKLRKKARKR